MERSRLKSAGRLLTFFVIYLLSAQLGLTLNAFAEGNVTIVWPPSGLSLAVLLLWGRRMWPGAAAGAFLVTALTGVPLLVAAGVATGNTLEALLGAWLLGRREDFHPSLDNLPSVLRLILLAALGSTLVSASLGVLSLGLGGVLHWEAAPSVWLVWWVGDMLSVLVGAPLLLTWAVRPRLPVPHAHWLEGLALGLLLFVTTDVVFADPLSLGLGRYSLAFIVFPGLIWAALRFGQRGVTASTLLVASVSLWSTVQGLDDPLVRARLRELLLLLQVFIGVLAATGQVLGAAVLARRRAEVEREALVEQLREAVRARDEFLSVASHELKTPLAALSLQVSALLRQLHAGRLPPGLEAHVERLTERTSRQISRLDRLIAALLDVSRIATGRLQLECTPVDLGELAREVVDSHRGELERSGTPVLLEVREGLVGRWDSLRLEQVLTNLLTNALKFGAGRPIEVRVYPVDDGRARLSVRDHGIGINPWDQARIFDRFERAVSAREFGGMGLGLYVSRQIVREHGGDIRVESSPGEGSTFIVELPLRPPPRHEASAPG